VLQADTEAPLCQFSTVRAGPPYEIDLTVQDSGSGLAAINLLAEENAQVTIPAFTVGTSEPVTVSAKIERPEGVLVAVEAVDVAGNVKSACKLEGVVVNGSLDNSYTTDFNKKKRIFSLYSTWIHIEGDEILAPQGIRIVELSGPACPCTVTDHMGQTGEEGDMFPVPWEDDLSDGVLSLGEEFYHEFQVKLKKPKPVTFLVDVWGVRFTDGDQLSRLQLTEASGHKSFEYRVGEDQLRGTTIYLPLIIKSP
jgi:hypothetical protein